MKKLFTLLIVMVASVGTMFANNYLYPVKIGDLDYYLNDDDYTARVTYNNFDGLSYNIGWDITTAIIPSSVTYDNKIFAVKEISHHAFHGCSSLTSIAIPNSVTSIGSYAFCGCKSLTSVTIPNGIISIEEYTFYGCSSLTSLTIPNCVTSIGDYAFGLCSGLTSVEIPNSVTSIGKGAFEWCYSLTSVSIPNSVTSIGEFAFRGCSSLTFVTIPNSVTSIGEATFSGCSSLTAVTIPNSVTNIGEWAFNECSSLTSVTIPNSVTSIEEFAFRDCSSLTSVHISDIAAWLAISFANPLYYAYNLYLNGTLVTDLDIPNSVTSIRNHAFYNCSSLTSVTIPNNITSIGESAFYNCSSLTSVTIPNSVTSIREGAFGGCRSLTSVSIPNSVTIIENHSFSGCSSLTSVTIPNSVTSIKSYAFSNCSSLTYLMIPNSVTSIGGAAFYDCSSLTSVTIPDSVQSIYGSTFEGCSKMAYAVIGRSVDHMDYDAFRHCSSLQYVKCLALNPPEMEHSEPWNNVVFEGVTCPNCPNAILFVPSESVELYKTAYQWKDFKSILPIGEADPTLYTIRFLNWNGDVLSEKILLDNKIPQYVGPTPTREKDEQYRYSFIGWTPEIVPVTEDAVYTATYRAIELGPITVRLDPQSCADWSVVRLWAWTSEGNLFDAWPGIVVSQDADGWYSYTFDESVESVNIIWTDGTNQTVNIEGVTASTCYALNSTSGKTITASVVDCGSTASNYYTIRFLNWDGTVLQSSQVKEGELPSYTGTTPVRPADEQYTYSFSGWSPAIATATADVDYTAQFTATEKTTDPSIPTVQDLATAGYDVANKVVLCLYFDDAPCYDVVIAGTYKADEAGSWITDPEQLVHMAALESFEGWYAAEIPYSSNAQGKPIQLKSNGAFSWEYQSGDADAWINKGGAGSQTAAIVAGYNNEADVYYPAPGCYIYELAYWKNHNNPCVIIPTHNYTIHLYAPDACEEMKPAIIGNFNNWTTGVAMSETTDEQGKKMYTITIADEEGKAFKFRDAAYDNWSNELQEYLSDVKVWATFSNFVLPAVTADTTIVFDFSDNSKYRFKLCEKVEDVVVWLKVPTGAPGYYNGAIEMVVYSADEPTAMPLQYNQEDELWSVELQAKGSNYFFVREANSEGNYILNYTHYYYSDGSDEYVWSTWGTTFQYYWEDGTGDFTGSKIIMLDISNPSYYKWDVPAIGTGIEDVLSDQVQCTKVIRNGQIFIIRGDKTYTLQGQEVK